MSTDSPFAQPTPRGMSEMALLHSELRCKSHLTNVALCVDAERECPCSPNTVLHYVRNVKKVRSFGVMLKLDFEALDKDAPSDTITLVITEWFARTVMSDSNRWEELYAALMAPSVSEPEIARSLPNRSPLIRKGLSVDSAISVPSLSARSPISFLDSSQYQPPYIGM